jgi:acyl-CoA synthetase (AMP-forming)/AMP-acid ligase II
MQGATAVLIRQFDAAIALDAVERTGITTIFAVPFMYAELAREQQSSPRDVSSLQTALVAADVCPPQVEVEFERVFRIPHRSFWAATEDVGVTIPDTRVGPYMRLLPEARVDVVGPDGRKVNRGEVGEMLTSSPATSPGYWRSATDHAADHSALSGGVFHSGDLVRELGPGLLQFVGRKKDIIVRGGSNISPHEVEAVLRVHPDVVDASVAGYPDDVLGQRVGALIVLADPTLQVSAAEEIRDWARQRLAGYKVPERIRFVHAIPRNRLMKIDRLAVSDALA